MERSSSDLGDIENLSFEAALAAARGEELASDEIVPGIKDPFKR